MEHFDLAAFYGGSATELYHTLGAHRTPDGWVFRVWAPHAVSVSVVGDFCAWDPAAHPMRRLDGGIWETEVAGLSPYDTYKFAVTARSGAARPASQSSFVICALYAAAVTQGYHGCAPSIVQVPMRTAPPSAGCQSPPVMPSFTAML